METWKSVPNFHGYECSNMGKVRSFKRKGKGGLTDVPHILKPGKRPNGYRFVNLSRNGKPHFISIHTLVMLTFIGPRPPKMETAHNNGIKHDNRLENLRYCTRIENELDKIKHGTSRAQFKLNGELVKDLRRQCIAAGPGKRFAVIRRLAKELDMNTKSIYAAARGLSWKHIKDPPPAF